MLNSIEKEIQDTLNKYVQVALSKELSDKYWTLDIKDKLGQIGQNRGYTVCTAGHPDKYLREWLYDMIWYSPDASGHIIELNLIYESEWSMSLDDIWYDFEKLLVAKCYQKLMFFQGTEKNINIYFEDMIKAIDGFKPSLSGERYFLIAYDLDNRKFQYKPKVIA